ncbi:UbiA prenyltransferase family-domain-containing protein [Mycena olivaceomarginata]|nr:UbiA prenyltransferase family-domain-containing protein [Mycena olivaceomarginata]
MNEVNSNESEGISPLNRFQAFSYTPQDRTPMGYNPKTKPSQSAYTWGGTNGIQPLSLSIVLASIIHEFEVFWAFTWRDWTTTIIPGMMYAITAVRSLPVALPPRFIALGLGRTLIYLILLIYTFTSSNQISSVAEDRINKPDRPIPSGRISLQGAYIRWYASTVAFLILGAAEGVMPWTVLWFLLTIAQNFTGFRKHWFTRNSVFISLGTLCIMQPMWIQFAPNNSPEWRWVLTLSVLRGILFQVQDFRDIVGDRAAGRNTLPLALGERSSRRVMAVLFAWTSVVDFTSGYWGGFELGMLYLAYRILQGASKEYNHQTYMVSTCFPAM